MSATWRGKRATYCLWSDSGSLVNCRGAFLDPLADLEFAETAELQ